MDLDHIKYVYSQPDLEETMSNEAYIVPGSILNIDLEILLTLKSMKALRGFAWQNYRMNLNT